jgi:hypothetical protein
MSLGSGRGLNVFLLIVERGVVVLPFGLVVPPPITMVIVRSPPGKSEYQLCQGYEIWKMC